jgi:hypothetical protein
MTIKEKILHSLAISTLFSLLNWFIIKTFIIDVTIVEYIFIEIVLIISIKLFKFTKLKLKLN